MARVDGRTSSGPVPPDAPSAEPWPSPRLAWAALLMLMAALVIACLDRAIINMLVEPIKADYRLTDTQFAALQGLAFGTLYVLVAIPLGYVADRYPRRLVIGAGMTIFSICSLSTGLARSYTHLFLARMGVGFGEASLSPTGLSLISDYFPPAKYGRAMSLFMMSNYIGTSAAYIVGGALIGWLDGVAAARPQTLHGFAPWQLTIIAIALPGLLLAPGFFLLPEPVRRGLAGTRARIGLAEVGREIGKRRRFIVLMIGGMSMASLMTNAVSVWTPALFIRVYGWSVAKTGLWLGIMIFVTAVAGSYLAGWMTDWLTRRRRADGPILIAALSFVGAGVFGVAAPLMPTPELALVCFMPVWVFKPMAFACAPMSFQFVMPNQIRAQTSAIYFTAMNLVGTALGPLAIGLMNDHLFSGGAKDVRYSLVLVTGVTVPLMAVLVLAARAPYRRLREALDWAG